MTENPATSTNDAASLLDAVKESQSAVRFITRPGIPELMLVVAAFCVAGIIYPTDGERNVVFSTSIAVVIASGVVVNAQRRHRFGLTLGRWAWAVAGFVGAGTIVSGATLEGHNRAIASALVFSAGVAVLALRYRSVLLAFFAGVPAILTATAVDGVPLWIPTVALLAYSLPVLWFGRHQLRGDK